MTETSFKRDHKMVLPIFKHHFPNTSEQSSSMKTLVLPTLLAQIPENTKSKEKSPSLFLEHIPLKATSSSVQLYCTMSRWPKYPEHLGMEGKPAVVTL